MNQLYHIPSWDARVGDMGGVGFSVQLFPAWKDAVAALGAEDKHVREGVARLAPLWLSGFGFNSPSRAPLYEAYSIRVSWGPWGPEHITVPGNACGLDLCDGVMAPPGGRLLAPHNVDTLRQGSLLMAIFLWFADHVVNGAAPDVTSKGY